MSNVILYTIGCPKCQVLKKKLDDNNIEYEICDDIPTMESLGINMLPVLSVCGCKLDFNKAVQWIKEQNS